jgi:LmbE family N-acetylglucosaminyl deacetylase
MRWIYFSPHLDDAVLSAGGLIHAQARSGLPVEVWTFMCGLPENRTLSDFAREMHAKWQTTSIEQTVALRRAEDRTATSMLGAKPIHFDFPDAIYRRGPDGDALYGEPLGVSAHELDAPLPRRIADAMQHQLAPDDVIVCPFAIGGHIDHVLVRAAAQELGRPLLHMADIPYYLNHPDELGKEAAGMQPALHPVSEEDLELWLEAIESYRSQLTSLFESWALLREAIRSYWAEWRGIRLWQSGDAGPLGGLDSALKS